MAVCRKFYRKGHCVKGDKCRYVHTLETAPPPVAVPEKPVRDGRDEARAQQREHKHRQKARKQQRHVEGCWEVANAAVRALESTGGGGDAATWFAPPPPVGAEVAWAALPGPCQMPAGFTPHRRQRKQWQVDNLACILRRLLPAVGDAGRRVTVADLGGGSGNAALPLAAGFPGVDFVLLDMNKSSCDLARERAAAAGLPNVRVECGVIEAVPWGEVREGPSAFPKVDVVLALHCCGVASDLAQLAAFAEGAAFILCPCCLGKIQQFTLDATKCIACPTFPRSAAIRAACGAADFAKVAALADHPKTHTEAPPCRDTEPEAAAAHAFATRARTLCKGLVERDRQLAAAERGYATVMTKLTPLEASPKHDVIVGLPNATDAALAEALGMSVGAPSNHEVL
eukprot:TRINITY_DN8347_c0_g3_i1.p1 TRINITY_DN8347_c0_g3~~TRINITY_DN8347_c0_g3_i1.p1  ORF type:complete len:444 (+),score=119.63 TRINITY_DN8347_c0_g3_i1:136-1332(+)